MVWPFIAGLVSGGTLGVLAMAFCFVSKEDD